MPIPLPSVESFHLCIVVKSKVTNTWSLILYWHGYVTSKKKKKTQSQTINNNDQLSIVQLIKYYEVASMRPGMRTGGSRVLVPVMAIAIYISGEMFSLTSSFCDHNTHLILLFIGLEDSGALSINSRILPIIIIILSQWTIKRNWNEILKLLHNQYLWYVTLIDKIKIILISSV